MQNDPFSPPDEGNPPVPVVPDKPPTPPADAVPAGLVPEFPGYRTGMSIRPVRESDGFEVAYSFGGAIVFDRGDFYGTIEASRSPELYPHVWAINGYLYVMDDQIDGYERLIAKKKKREDKIKLDHGELPEDYGIEPAHYLSSEDDPRYITIAEDIQEIPGYLTLSPLVKADLPNMFRANGRMFVKIPALVVTSAQEYKGAPYFRIVRFKGGLYKLVPRNYDELYKQAVDEIVNNEAIARVESAAQYGSPTGGFVEAYRARTLLSNKHGYVKISNLKPRKSMVGVYSLANLLYVNKTAVRDIEHIIDFPPKFNGDLLWLQGKHFYSPTNDAFYYYVGTPGAKVGCYYRAQYILNKRLITPNKCDYIKITETNKYPHSELYTVAGYRINFAKMLLFKETEKRDDGTLPPMEGNEGTDPFDEPYPVQNVKVFKIGPFTLNLPGESDTDFKVRVDEYDEKHRAHEELFQQLREEWIQKYGKSVSVVPNCRTVLTKIPGLATDEKISVYSPANIYQGRTFFCPGDNIYYFYVRDFLPDGDHKNVTTQIEVTYRHAPGNADYEDAESIASGYFISLTEFDQMILNS